MLEILIETKEGTRLKVRKDKTHFRAFDDKGEQVGPARIAVESLLEALNASMIGELGVPEAATEPHEIKAGHNAAGWPMVSPLSAINEMIDELEFDLKHIARKKCCAAVANSILIMARKIKDRYTPKDIIGAKPSEMGEEEAMPGAAGELAPSREPQGALAAGVMEQPGDQDQDARAAVPGEVNGNAPDKQGPDEPEQD